MTENDAAMLELIKGIQYLIKKNDNGTKIYTGLVMDIENNIYSVKMNGNIYSLSKYGNNVVNVGSTVKVFVPQNNMNLAFII